MRLPFIDTIIKAIRSVLKAISTAEVVFNREPEFITVCLPAEGASPEREIRFRPETAYLIAGLRLGNHWYAETTPTQFD